MLDIITIANEHFWRMHSKVLQCTVALAKPSGSFEGRSPGNLQQGVS